MSEIQHFSQQDIEILGEQTLYEGFFTLKQIQFKHKLFAGGQSGVVTRELLIKGAASAVIAYDPKEDSVILVEQVRIGAAYHPESNRSPWLLELIAGMVEKGEKPEEVALRESEEEAGIQVKNLTHCLSVWDSPGGIVERITARIGEVMQLRPKGANSRSVTKGIGKNGEIIDTLPLGFYLRKEFTAQILNAFLETKSL
ncbi:TPA: NUDIX domain-containing protein [Haemophilus influenzae]